MNYATHHPKDSGKDTHTHTHTMTNTHTHSLHAKKYGAHQSGESMLPKEIWLSLQFQDLA